ncbi:hypothetical protein TL18_02795 [Methanobrevibacter sp. YE315]|uniref:hypothetical protein n=1 Tax=Methanobrevibacter sp. YE315 TaxID=1609968 RepID=UPI000764F104|nr:hypothetical protein [Methanobrevibacter sp. YE315]AMD17044.1 hypothetical protein TL18_02795 [Methanobrevibacter sp. YE315]
MEGEGNIIIPIIGYIVALVSPILGLVYGTIMFFYKKDVELYRKHGRYLIYFSIVIFVINLILVYGLGWFR